MMFRSFVWLKSLVRNRAYPEGSIAEGYTVEECLTFCSRFLEGTTRFTRTSRNPDPSDNTKGMYMFDSVGEPIGKAFTVGQFDDQLLVQAHRYVLRHTDELDGLRRCASVLSSISVVFHKLEKIMMLFFLLLQRICGSREEEAG